MTHNQFAASHAAVRFNAKLAKRCAAAATASLLWGVSSADQVTYVARLQGATGSTLTGSALGATLFLPKFDSTLGMFESVSFSHTDSFEVNALSSAQGGTFIPPVYVDSWSWAAVTFFSLSGPGFSIPTSTLLTSSGSGNYAFAHSASVSKTEGNSSLTSVISATSSHALAYLGAGTVPLSFTAGVTTAVAPLPATPGGFTWLTSTVTGAGIAQVSDSTISIVYTYTPFPAVAEPPSFLMLSIGGLLLTALARRQ